MRRDRERQAAELLLQRLVARDDLGDTALGRLGERVGARPHQTLAVDGGREAHAVELAGTGDEPHLELAGAPALADDEVAQKARVRAAVERAQTLLATPREHLVARGVRAFRGEQAVADRDDLVPRAGCVEAAEQRAVVPGAEGVLELVAIAPLLHRRDDVVEHVALEVPDPRQRVADLLVLDGELALVGQHLPGRAGMVGARCDPLGARLEHLERARLGVGALALRDDGAHAVAGHGAGDEDDVTLHARDAVAAVGERVDGEVELGALLGTDERGGLHMAVQDRWRLPRRPDRRRPRQAHRLTAACARSRSGPSCGWRCGARGRGPCAARPG